MNNFGVTLISENKITKNKLEVKKIYLETRGRTSQLLLLVSFAIINNKKYCIFYNIETEKYEYPIEIDEFIDGKLKYFKECVYNMGMEEVETYKRRENIINGLKNFFDKHLLNDIQFFNDFVNINRVELNVEEDNLSTEAIAKINLYRKSLIKAYKTSKKPNLNNEKISKLTFYGKDFFLIPSRNNSNYISPTNESNENLTSNQIATLHHILKEFNRKNNR
jgi:hypothetical protein